MDGKMIYKKGQVTIFIIVAIIIIALIMLFFLVKSKGGMPFFQQSMPNPYEYMEKCVKDNVNEAINLMLPQGGYLSPEHYTNYKDNKVEYLCYTKEYYKPCINQNPLLIEHLKKEIKRYSEGKIKDCFYALENEYKKRNYNVETGSMTFDIELEPNQAIANIKKKIEIKKNEETRKFDNFKFKINSPIYDFGIISEEIANQEAKFCYFEYLGYSLLYPSFKINKDEINSDTKIYTIEEKASKKKMTIAIRSCAFPAGI